MEHVKCSKTRMWQLRDKHVCGHAECVVIYNKCTLFSFCASGPVAALPKSHNWYAQSTRWLHDTAITSDCFLVVSMQFMWGRQRSIGALRDGYRRLSNTRVKRHTEVMLVWSTCESFTWDKVLARDSPTLTTTRHRCVRRVQSSLQNVNERWLAILHCFVQHIAWVELELGLSLVLLTQALVIRNMARSTLGLTNLCTAWPYCSCSWPKHQCYRRVWI